MIYITINGGRKMLISKNNNVNLENLANSMNVYNVRCKHRKINRSNEMKKNPFVKPNTEEFIEHAVLYNDTYRIMSWKRGIGWKEIKD